MMLLLPLLLSTVAAPTAIDSERAFAAMAQTEGQWTAFRAFAASEAVMFVPEAVNARQWLAGRADPAVSVMWWPGRSWISCDGKLAVNTGPWVRAGGQSVGYFTTVWARQPEGGWKWLLDHGDTLAAPRPAGDRVEPRRAACGGGAQSSGDASGSDLRQGGGASADGTLRWRWVAGEEGARTVTVELWNGGGYETVLEDHVAAQ